MCPVHFAAGARIYSGEGCLIRATAIAYGYPVDPWRSLRKANRRNEKRIYFRGWPGVARANLFALSDAMAEDPAVALSGADAAPLPQQLRRIDAICAPEELGELGRIAEAVLSGYPGQR